MKVVLLALSGDLARWRNKLLELYPHSSIELISRAEFETGSHIKRLKALRALRETGLATLVVSGGVGANRALRDRLTDAAAARGARVYFPRLEFCTDNAAMIAIAGLLRFKHSAHSSLAVSARARWPLESLDVLSGAA